MVPECPESCNGGDRKRCAPRFCNEKKSKKVPFEEGSKNGNPAQFVFMITEIDWADSSDADYYPELYL